MLSTHPNAIASRKWRLKNPEYKRELNRKWYNKESTPQEWAKRKVGLIRKAAKRRNLEFALTQADILPLIVEQCPITSLELDYRLFGKHRPLPNSPSIDRIDNSKGYIPTNVVIVSHLANKLKGELTKEQLMEYLPKMLAFYGK